MTTKSSKNTPPVTGHRKPVTGSRNPAAGRRKPVAGTRRPVAGSRSPEAGGRSPVAGHRSPVAGRRSPVAGSRSPEPGAADRTRLALTTALVRLLAARGARGVSVRALAAAAGVNHGLVHRYFGSKERLVREVVGAVSAEVHAGVAAAVGPTGGTFAQLRGRPELARIVARACLDGPHDLLPLAAPPPEWLDRTAAGLRRAGARVGLGTDPYVLCALGAAAVLGWVVFRPLLAAGYRLPADADEQLARLFAAIDGAL